jgi:hypothetical protein
MCDVGHEDCQGRVRERLVPRAEPPRAHALHLATLSSSALGFNPLVGTSGVEVIRAFQQVAVETITHPWSGIEQYADLVGAITRAWLGQSNLAPQTGDIREGPERTVRRQWLHPVRIQSGSANPPFAQRLEQRVINGNTTARNRDGTGRRLHRSKARSSKTPGVCGVLGAVTTTKSGNFTGATGQEVGWSIGEIAAWSWFRCVMIVPPELTGVARLVSPGAYRA